MPSKKQLSEVTVHQKLMLREDVNLPNTTEVDIIIQLQDKVGKDLDIYVTTSTVENKKVKFIFSIDEIAKGLKIDLSLIKIVVASIDINNDGIIQFHEQTIVKVVPFAITDVYWSNTNKEKVSIQPVEEFNSLELSVKTKGLKNGTNGNVHFILDGEIIKVPYSIQNNKMNVNTSIFEKFINTVTVTGGTLQIIAGGLLSTSGWGAVIGIPLVGLGVNNIQEVFYGNKTVRNYVNNLAGSDYGYTGVDLVFSLGVAAAGSMTRVGLKEVATSSNAITKVSPVYNIQTKAGKRQAVIELYLAGNTIMGETIDNK